MLETYRTILEYGTHEIIEKKSRFIASFFPVKTEEEAREYIDMVKKEHRTANHNVFAYRIGERDELQRMSDDGEPQGTAGMPMLSVLQGLELKNVLVVVTRYFGGTLLGTGGLVRAYGGAVKEGLEALGFVTLQRYQKYMLHIAYSDHGKVQYELLQKNHTIYDTIYGEGVELVVYVRSAEVESFEKLMIDLFRGEAVFSKEEWVYAYEDETVALQLVEEGSVL
ncbi:MAG: YigZ family protein [Bacillota bacterium]